ncbi:hypothetical protein ACIBG8_23495 [Nonomuraea sp. NPDC050556]|uniref:hypothetical protein n=1 Tax=Nonomuraea sp. NPDC050556 TaxID=3364369 RepID=UPI0037929CCF
MARLALTLGFWPTVKLFVQLKLRLISGNLRGDATRKIGFVFTLIGALCVAGFGFLGMSAIRFADADLATDIGVVAFTVFLIGWAIVPLLAFGLDDTLDPSRLTLFPLRTQDLAVGMFSASATGVWPAASLIVLAGGVVGLSRSVGGALIGVLAVLLEFALCLVTSRLITTALSGALRTRRGRDVLAVAAIFVVVLAQLPNLIINRGLGGDMGAMVHGLANALRWVPSGMAAHAIADGGLLGIGELVVVALLAGLIGWLWIRSLGRALVTTDASTQGASVRRSSGFVDRFLPDGQLAAVVDKELRYIRRDPRFRVGWFSSVVVTAIIAFSLSGKSGPSGAIMVVGPACLGALMLGMQTANVFGIDGRSLWMNSMVYSSPRDLRTDLAGRHIAVGLLATPLLAILALAVGLFTGELSGVVPAMLTAWGVLGVGLGVGAVTSVIVPYTTPDRLNAFSGAAPGQGGLAFLGSFGSMLGTGFLVLPLVPVLFGVTWVAFLAVPYGLLISALGRRLGGVIGYPRLPELLVAVSKPT